MLNKFLGCVLCVVISTAMVMPVQAKKYKPINEIPGQVPETKEEEQIWKIGKAHQAEIRKNGEALNNHKLELYLESIVHKLLGDMVDEIGLDVDVIAYKDTTVNAWVYPNGTVAVHTGMLAAMHNEAQLAAIMAHELSHFLNRHAFQQIKSKQKNSILGKGLGILATAVVAAKTGNLNTGLMQTGQIWADLATSGYSKKHEVAADKQGIQFYANAGYPLEESLLGFEVLRIPEDDSRVNVSKIWSSHPDIDSRKKNISKLIKKMDKPSVSYQLDPSDYTKSVGIAVLVNSQLLVSRREYSKAVALLENYTEQDPQNANGHYLLGEALRKKSPEGDYGKRITSYQNAVSKNTQLINAYRELGLAYRQQGKTELAKQSFRQYLQLSPVSLEAPIIQWYLDNAVSQRGER